MNINKTMKEQNNKSMREQINKEIKSNFIIIL